MTALELAAGLGPRLVHWRRHLHRYPELSFEEHETAAYLVAELRALGVGDAMQPTPTSVMARIIGVGPGPVVVVRADIDALPIDELTGLEYASERPGVMHACGHDGHAAVLLGAAAVLASDRSFGGEIRLLFQHAEERPPGGAKDMIAAGVMEGVDAVFACHLLTLLDTGRVAVLTGPCMAGADMFTLRIKGFGGHGALPHQTTDPIVVGAQLVTNFQHVVARRVDPVSPAVVSVTRFSGGTADNVIPAEVELGGTVRAFESEVLESVRAEMARIARGITEAHGATHELTFTGGYNPCVNDPGMAELARAVVAETEGAGVLQELAPLTTSDDFAEFLRSAPGAYVFVGARNAVAGSTHPHHDAHFTIDEDALAQALRILVGTALRALERLSTATSTGGS